jgi:uncharacterized membrane protein YkoI
MYMHERQIISGGLTALLMLMSSTSFVQADDKSDARRNTRQSEPAAQQDQVLDAVKRGEIRPFPEIQAAAESVMPGQVVGVEIKRRKGRLVYEFKIITAGGRLREVYVDAATLDIVKVE